MKRFIVPLLLACAAAACGSEATGPDPRFVANPACASPAPLLGTPHPQTADSYIVVFHDGVAAAPTAGAIAAKYGFQTKHVYEHALLGFAATMSSAVLAGVRCESAVKYVAHDGVVRGS